MPGKQRTHQQAIRFTIIVFYVVLLVASHVYQYAIKSGVDGAHASKLGFVTLDAQGSSVRVFYDQWVPEDQLTDRAGVLLIHGSPGSAQGLSALARLIAQQNRRVIAPDLPGYGRSDWASDLSYTSQAKYMAAMLDALGVDRVHVVGWSSGSGVAIEMADQFPERIASITLLAGIGAQETEGSGSYFFEHAKYGVGFVGLGVIPELIPHFGSLGSFKARTGWIKAFWDSDQRKLTRIMPTIKAPVLILHGRNDPLVPAWGAEQHHAMMPTSQLVMLDASHFLPFTAPNETAEYLNAFFDRHDQPGVVPETGYVNLAPVPDRHGFDRLLHAGARRVHTLPWWGQLVGIIVLVRCWRLAGFALAILLVAMMRVDFGVALLGMMLGRWWWLIRRAHAIDRPWTPLGWARGIGFALPALLVGLLAGPWVLELTHRFGLIGFIAGFGALVAVLATMRLIVTWEGRQRLKGEWNRITSHEYWVKGIVYLPVLWWGFKRVVSGKGLRVITAANPGYASDGGVQGESKIDINRKLGDGHVDDHAVLHCVLIASDNDRQRRIASAIDAVRNDPGLGGFPVFCKPDRGECGRAVEMIASESDLVSYCQTNDEPFVIQKCHDGAVEVGVLWVRHTESILNPDYQGPSGFIYAITIKHFPVVVGDGRRPIRRLILGHKRYRAQSRMFFERLRDRLGTIPEKGQPIALGVAGNHAQGAKFTDGAHLITPALSTRIGEIVDRFKDDHGRGFDIGRFDLRCQSLEALAQGEGFGIVELNGMTSEPTNLYDPDRSIFWAWRMLLGYWKHVEQLAQARLETNTGAPTDGETYRAIKRALVRVMIS